MKKSRIVLAAIAVLAIAGGGLAFKASKYTGIKAYTSTTRYSTFGTLYQRAGNASFVGPNLTVFTTPALPGVTSTIYSTTGTAAGPITLTRVGGTETITIPNWLTSTYSTLVTFVD